MSYGFLLFAVAMVLTVLSKWIIILREYERAVTFWLGKLDAAPKGPGFVFIFWPFQTMERISLRTVVLDVPPQDVITKDNVSVRVNAVLYFRVMEPERAIIEVEDYLFATSQLAQTTLRSVLGQAELDELLSERESLNLRVQTILDEATDAWGIKVMTVEMKDVDLPVEMKRAMAKQAEAERERRAKVIHAEGEFQASQRLSDAAGIIEVHPVALQLRYLQALTEIAAENNSTTLFPVPVDLFTPFLKKMAETSG